MTDRWYFGWDKERFGPFSAAQLKELGALGKLQPTDTVWEEGLENGVLADSIKNLFADPPAEALHATDPGALTIATDLKPITNDNDPRTQKKPLRKGRAVAVKGAVILGQDGEIVQYRKKCIKCAYEDACRSRMPIRNGVNRERFFCPKCRKLGEVIIQGIT